MQFSQTPLSLFNSLLTFASDKKSCQGELQNLVRYFEPNDKKCSSKMFLPSVAVTAVKYLILSFFYHLN